jgi:hypothetical protein
VSIFCKLVAAEVGVFIYMSRASGIAVPADFKVSKIHAASDDRWSQEGLFIWRIAVYCAAFGRFARP